MLIDLNIDKKRRSLNEKSGLDIQSIVDAVMVYQKDAHDRAKLLDYLTNSFDHYMSGLQPHSKHHQLVNSPNSSSTVHKRRIVSEANKQQENEQSSESDSEDFDLQNHEEKPKFSYKLRRFYRIFCIHKGKRLGNYLLALFVFVKLLFTLNSIVQLFLLNHFLGNDYLILGLEVLAKVWSGDDWTQLKRFPRVTMCDFRIREIGIVHRYTVSEFQKLFHSLFIIFLF
jgi:hypothetical protein